MKKIMSILTASALLIMSCGKSNEAGKQAEAAAAQPQEVTRIVGVARVEPEEGLLKITAGTEGKILQLLVKENEMVQKGQEIAVISTDVQKAQLVQAQSKMEGQNALIAANEAAVKASEANLQTLMTKAESARIHFEKAQNTYALNQQLLEAKGTTQQVVDNSRFDRDQAEKDWQQAQQNVNQQKATIQQQQATVRNSQARVKELNADVSFYQTQLNQKRITAPLGMKVLSWDIKVGDFVVGSTPLGQFAPKGNLVAVTEVDEVFAQKVHVGQKAEIKSQSTGEVLGVGEVVFAQEFLKKKSLFEDESNQEDRRVREVKIRLNADAKALINARVDCIIHLNHAVTLK